MVTQVLLGDKAAYKVKAKEIWPWGKATLYQIDDIEIWIPHKLCKYNRQDETLIIVDWFYEKNIDNNVKTR